jgi:hypothetical protein
MQGKTTLDLSPALPAVAFCSIFFALDQLAQSASHQKGYFMMTLFVESLLYKPKVVGSIPRGVIGIF